MKIKKIHFLNVSLFTTVLSLFFHTILYADNNSPASLYGYHGYLTTPSAYIADGSWRFHYSYLPKGAGPFHKGKSDNWIFTSSLGLFPFMECFFSVYVSPEHEWEVSGRGDTTRSPGVKIKLFNEKKNIPAVSVGVFDPKVGLGDKSRSIANVSSIFIVGSKKVGRSSISIGYGFNAFKSTHARLSDVFGGIDVYFSHFLSLMVDYDGENLNEGLYAHWKGLNMSIAYVGESIPAYRIGYNLNLNHR
ncbi:MAG: hypothetical protein HOC71_12500 [Candidatus Latescibacteria bacterium]|nr:hypothetical protein [Candidatus Latescibacterota bacterium]